MIRRVLAWGLVFGCSSVALSWNPLELNPVAANRWDTSAPVEWNPDAGLLGAIDNASAVTQVDTAFGVWAAVNTSAISYVQGVPIVDASATPVDVTVSNYPEIMALSNGQNPIIFDNTGEIFELLGFGPTLLGVAGALETRGTEIVKGFVILAGRPVDGLPEPGENELTTAELQAVMVHEIGHFNGLGHSAVNHQFFEEGLDGCGLPPLEHFETMGPFLNPAGSAMAVLHHDEKIGISALYPTIAFTSSSAGLRGTLFDTDGVSALSRGNMVLRPDTADCDDLYATAQATIPGVNPGETGGAGSFEFTGLLPGIGYTVQAGSVIDGDFYALTTQFQAPDDYFNGSNEGSTNPPDHPDEATTVLAGAAQSVVTGIDIVLNEAVRAGEISPSGADALLVEKTDEDTPLPSEILQIEDTAIPGTAPWAPGQAWINRFTLAPGDPVHRVEQILIFFANGNAEEGRPIRLLVYVDPAGTGDPANATLVHQQDVEVDGAFVFYTLSTPVPVETGEFYLGGVDLEPTPSTSALPALDQLGPGLRSYVATGSTAPGDFELVRDAGLPDDTWVIRAFVVKIPPPGSVRLVWGDPCSEYQYAGMDYVVYEGSQTSFGPTLDHAPIACSTIGKKNRIVFHEQVDRYWLVSPTLDGSEGFIGEGSNGSSRTPATTCLPVDPDPCP